MVENIVAKYPRRMRSRRKIIVRENLRALPTELLAGCQCDRILVDHATGCHVTVENAERCPLQKIVHERRGGNRIRPKRSGSRADDYIDPTQPAILQRESFEV